MSETDPLQPSPLAAEPDPSESGGQTPPGPGGPRRTPRGGIRGFFRQIRTAGRDAVSVALGKLVELPPEPGETESKPAPPAETTEKTSWRVSMLHTAAEGLRGAADSYIAAKLDEIEARVDAKLDHVETRIDSKIVELHRQLREMRDRELQHRLRLLKITLIFTVLVAALSLGYKWLAKYIAG